MIVSLDVDGYTKTLNNRIILRETQKNNNTKTDMQAFKEVPGFYIWLARGAIRLFESPVVTPLVVT